jgi:AcrR family transcriptional regulator
LQEVCKYCSLVPMMTGVTDGRVRRGEENRTALVEALISLYEDGELTPTATQIANRAGVAVRSVYGHFGDIETLANEVIERQVQLYGPLMDPTPIDGPLVERIEKLVARRAELFEAVAPVRRAGLLHVHDNETIASNLRRLARLLRVQVAKTFAPEIDDVRRPRSAALLDGADLLLSWEAWERLRTQQGCSLSRARRVLQDALIRLLEPKE